MSVVPQSAKPSRDLLKATPSPLFLAEQTSTFESLPRPCAPLFLPTAVLFSPQQQRLCTFSEEDPFFKYVPPFSMTTEPVPCFVLSNIPERINFFLSSRSPVDFPPARFVRPELVKRQCPVWYFRLPSFSPCYSSLRSTFLPVMTFFFRSRCGVCNPPPLPETTPG